MDMHQTWKKLAIGAVLATVAVAGVSWIATVKAESPEILVYMTPT